MSRENTDLWDTDRIKHIPVLPEESVELLLNRRKGGTLIDATLGGGSTSKLILDNLDSTGRVIGIDRDRSAIEFASRRLKSYSNFTAVWENFRELDNVLNELGITAIDGLLADLGISSIQLDDESRGFGFKSKSRIDMRYDLNRTGTSAYDLLKDLDEKSLQRLFKEFGEEKRWAGRIASKIVTQRLSKPIETPAELAELVKQSIPKRFHSRRIHPATKIFLALRIAVNDELESLREGLEKAIDFLRPGGRIVIISYHSLEDRIVKRTFRKYSREPEKKLRIITKKPVTPTQKEIDRNRRARSAKMRVTERI